jgi:hypothetical protein
MEIYLDYQRSLIPLKLKNTLVLLDKEQKVIREITWDDYIQLALKYPEEVADDQLSLKAVIIAEMTDEGSSS